MTLKVHRLHREVAEAHTAGVSKELGEREACLGQQLDAARAEAEAAAVEQAAEAEHLRGQLELRLLSLQDGAASWQVR